MKKILVPTDFSPNEEKSLNYAVQLAKKTNGELLLIHSVKSDNYEEDIKNAEARLEIIGKTITESEGVKIDTKVYFGPTENSIRIATSENNIDMVIMGTLGNTAFVEKVFGSITASVIGKTIVPLLAIPLLSDWKTPKKILLAINEFKEKDKEIQPVVELARLFNASIQLAIFTDTDDDFVEDFAEHEAKISTFRDLLREKYKDIEIHAVHLASRKFKESLINWVDNKEIDMVAMLTHKKNIIEKIFSGSKTKKVSYYINVPLLAIPV